MSSEVISISVYNRYTPPAWAMRPANAYPRASPPARSREEPRRESPKPEPAKPEPAKSEPAKPESPKPEPSGPAMRPPRGSGLSGLLPAGLDAGDLFLAAMLLFLYSESHDEDFLIMLIVVGLSIFQKK